eukprot:TRINITY_DN2708_c0_g1_i1.p1 TRINITY_DN2708_c0_g1~~TRINITY_DN2708_c0_g1_i1.p1  ORF type:complete len:565 (-),score=138.49 TRINITY_DN2708_c0_g1_i1:98-1756(-)
MSTSVWGVPRRTEGEESGEVTSLSEIMSEQLAVDLSTSVSKGEVPLIGGIEDIAESGDDLAIARALQAQFDREYNEEIQREERALNGGSKVSVSLNKFKSLPSVDYGEFDYSDTESLDSDEGDIFAREHIPRCGYKKNEHGEFVTKHDPAINILNNSRRVLESFPPGISTGEDVRVSNVVYNEMKRFTVREGRKRASRVKDKEDKATQGEVTDPKTKLILYKMVNNGLLDNVGGIISTGKEAVILQGEAPDTQVAIKVFKTTLNEFKNREKYIRDDYRFKDRFSKQNPRKVVTLWAEKEMHNLGRMHRAGINVPAVLALKKHVLVMTFIGGPEGQPAPKLKEAHLSSSDWKRCYSETLQTIKTIYSDCHLVHGDLSEYNILWQNKRPVFIDVSQAVEPTHPHALEFLYRDISNVSAFFSSRIPPSKDGEEDIVKSPEQVFTEVTGLSLDPDHDITAQLCNYQEEGQYECFDSQWNKSLSGAEPISIPSGRLANPVHSSHKSPEKSSGTSAKSLVSMSPSELKALKESLESSPPCQNSSPSKQESLPKVSFAP